MNADAKPKEKWRKTSRWKSQARKEGGAKGGKEKDGEGGLRRGKEGGMG